MGLANAFCTVLLARAAATVREHLRPHEAGNVALRTWRRGASSSTGKHRKRAATSGSSPSGRFCDEFISKGAGGSRPALMAMPSRGDGLQLGPAGRRIHGAFQCWKGRH